jgi:N-acetylmuramoyl-L-alanine amidase
LSRTREIGASSFITDPPRPADIEGIDLIPMLRELVAKVKSDDPSIRHPRGAKRPGVVRAWLIDLKQPIAPQVFTPAPPGGGLSPVPAGV